MIILTRVHRKRFRISLKISFRMSHDNLDTCSQKTFEDIFEDIF